MSSRDPWFDNAKMALVVLVVVGHAWSLLLPDSATNGWLYEFLYTWHMPAFVLVSGYFSRSFDWSSPRLRAMVATLVVPFVVYQAALACFQVAIGWPAPPHPFLEPLWPLWYLAALVAWRLAAPAFLRVPPVTALAAATALSLLGGRLDVSYLSLPRVLGMLPFYVLGLVATPAWVERLRAPGARRTGVAGLGLVLVLAHGLDGWAGTSWLYFRPYDVIGAGLGQGVAVRATLLSLALVGALSFLALVPRQGGWFARMGAATMTVYLVHGFVVRGVDAAGLFAWTALHPQLGRLVVVAAAVGLALALGSAPAVRALHPVVDPVGWWRGRRPDRAPDAVEPAHAAVRAGLDTGAPRLLSTR